MGHHWPLFQYAKSPPATDFFFFLRFSPPRQTLVRRKRLGDARHKTFPTNKIHFLLFSLLLLDAGFYLSEENQIFSITVNGAGYTPENITFAPPKSTQIHTFHCIKMYPNSERKRNMVAPIMITDKILSQQLEQK